MKRNILLIALALATTTGFSQVIKKDNDNIFEVQSSHYKSWMGSDGITKNFLRSAIYLAIVTDKQTNENFLELHVKTHNRSFDFPNSTLFLQTKDNTIELPFTDKRTRRNRVIYSIAANDIKKLANTDLVNFKLVSGNETIDFDIKEKKKEVLKKTFELTADRL